MELLQEEKQPLISIIVPCYNVEQYLSKCIESILNQTYQNIEVFLVDDGSPDKCGQICDEYAEKDSRIKVIHKENGGLADARNAALDLITGEYVVCVDSDDYISPTHIEGLYRLIEKHGAQVAVNSFCPFVEGNPPNPNLTRKKERVFSGIKSVETMFYQELFDTTAWGKMYKSELFYGVRYPKGLLFEDLPTTYKLLIKAEKVVFQDEESYYYFLRHNSIEGSPFSPHKLDSTLRVIELMERDKKRMQPIIKSYNCRIVSFLFHLMLQMPKEQIYRSNIETMIRKMRWSVMLDRRARKKTRIACLLSFCGFQTTQKIFNKVKPR